ncbi:hypothetical protein FH972_025027 [Carpinus fangiana]|uniref:RRM domain-containing protein n=1 Tax=Carpinus fangiana TaxID=176857 RepID=A0A5N6L0Q7_9ROSI|nr:hypothetical protein FH972_025027 [Carpinus fangiana]
MAKNTARTSALDTGASFNATTKTPPVYTSGTFDDAEKVGGRHGSVAAGITGGKEAADSTHRMLKPRHIQLIGIGGTIGTALYVQIGRGLLNGGRYVEESFGVAAGWNFFVFEAALVPFEIVACNVIIHFWSDAVPAGGIIAIVIVLYGLINVMAVKWYGESEFWAALGQGATDLQALHAQRCAHLRRRLRAAHLAAELPAGQQQCGHCAAVVRQPRHRVPVDQLCRHVRDVSVLAPRPQGAGEAARESAVRGAVHAICGVLCAYWMHRHGVCARKDLRRMRGIFIPVSVIIIFSRAQQRNQHSPNRGHLQLLHGSNVGGLHVVLKLLDLLLQLVQGDFVILDDQIDLQLLDTEAEGNQLGRTPNKTVLLNGTHTRFKLLHIGLVICFICRLDLASLLLTVLLQTLRLQLLCLGILLLVIGAEEVDIVVIVGRSSSACWVDGQGRGLGAVGGDLLGWVTRECGELGLEAGDVLVPAGRVWELLDSWCLGDSLEDLDIGLGGSVTLHQLAELEHLQVKHGKGIENGAVRGQRCAEHRVQAPPEISARKKFPERFTTALNHISGTMGSGKKRRRDADEEGESAAPTAGESAAVEPPSDATEPTKKRVQQRRTLFVRALPATTTTESLIEHFSEAYPIKHATAVIDPATQQCKGYGFITFADAEDAQKAQQEFQGSAFQGRKLKLEVAEPRHRDVDDTIPGERQKSKPNAAAAEAKAKREQARPQNQPPPKLIIRNLPWSIKKPEQLTKLFLSYGKVKHAVIPQKKPGLQSGFGFVTIRGQKNAENALKGVNGLEIDGRTLAVDWAVNKDAWQAQNPTPEDSKKDGQEDDEEPRRQDDYSEADFDDGEDEDEDESIDDDQEDLDMEESMEEAERPPQTYSSTLFIRNLPFTSTDESLQEHFEQFGGIRYARIVVDPTTERPRGTGFVCFFSEDDATECLKSAPRDSSGPATVQTTKAAQPGPRSILQSEEADPSGKFTMEGRVLQVSRAVDRSEATRLTEVGVAHRGRRDNDKRRLYLLSEGTISSGSTLYALLSQSEVAMREQSAKQRKTMVQSNPSLNLSLTRLSIRNIPRTITSKDLKQLAREAVVGFATDVKGEKRERISKEELARGGEEMVEAEKERRAKGKGLVKQAKVVFEGREGAKVAEDSGAGRSRGYGFIEYYTHRAALMGLRWLNGHAVGYQAAEPEKGKSKRGPALEKSKRLIVEFAIENAQVVHRRKERESNSRDPARRNANKDADADPDSKKPKGRKGFPGRANGKETNGQEESKPATKEEEKQAARSRIIAKKRAQRRDKRSKVRGGAA